MSKLSGKQISNYIEKGGVACPRCESLDIFGHNIETDAGGALQKCSCQECNLEWTDLYRLTEIVDVSG